MPPWKDYVASASNTWDSLLWDGMAEFYPWRAFAARAMRNGELALWNPHQACGMPFLANGQSALLYPPTWLFGVLPVARAFSVNLALHMILAAVLTFLYLRTIGCRRFAAGFAAAAFAGNGFFAAWANLPTMLASAVWLPAALWTGERMLAGPRRPAWAMALGVSLGLSVLAGHLQTGSYVVIASLGYLAIRAVAGGRTALLSRLGWLVAAMVVAGLLAAGQLFPSLEMANYSQRGVERSLAGLAAWKASAMPRVQLARLVFPFAFGSGKDGTYWPGQGTFSEYSCYVGTPILLMALVSSPGKRRGLWALGVLGALLSLDAATGGPTAATLFFLLPAAGSSARMLVVWAFSVSLLCALGLDGLVELQANKRAQVGRVLRSLGAAVVLAGVSVAVIARAASSGAAAWDWLLLVWPRDLVLFVAGLALLCLLLVRDVGRRALRGWAAAACLLLAVDLGSYWARCAVASPVADAYPRTALTDLLQSDASGGRVMPLSANWQLDRAPTATLPPNAAMAYGLDDVQGYDSLILGGYKSLLAAFLRHDPSPAINGNMMVFEDWDADLARLLGVSHVVAPGRVDGLGLPFFAERDGVFVYEMKEVGSRSQLFPFPSAVVVRNDLGAVVRNVRAHRDLAPPGEGFGKVEWKQTSPNVMTCSVDAPGEAALVVRDTMYPGWRACVDGHPAPISGALGVFRSVRVAAGKHQVAFTYQPSSVAMGLFLLLLGNFAVAAVLSRALAGRRR